MGQDCVFVINNILLFPVINNFPAFKIHIQEHLCKQFQENLAQVHYEPPYKYLLFCMTLLYK
jgi:hypothetical protein